MEQTEQIEQVMRLVADVAAISIRQGNEAAADYAVQAGYLLESAHRAARVGCPMIAADLMGDAQAQMQMMRAAMAPLAVAS